MDRLEINLEELEDGERLVPTAVAAEMVSCLTSESIDRAYTTTSHNAEGWSESDIDNSFLFLGLLHTMCQNYIKQKALVPKDPAYKKIVGNLAALSGMANAFFSLSDAEMRYCVKNELIPISVEAQYGEVDPSQPLNFVPKKRFDDVMKLASMILAQYQMPDDPDRPTQGNMDGYWNLCYGAADWCASAYKMHKSFEEYMRKSQAEKVTVERHKADNSLDFDL